MYVYIIQFTPTKQKLFARAIQFEMDSKEESMYTVKIVVNVKIYLWDFITQI